MFLCRLLALLVCTAVPCLAAGSRPLNGVAAIVNDRVITYRDVNEYSRFALAQLNPRGFANRAAMEQAQLRVAQDATETLIVRELILAEYAEAATNKFRIPESMIDEQIERQVKQRFGDRVTMAKSLKAAGKSFEDFRQEQREEFIIQVMRSHNVNQQLFISPQKIADYYERRQTNYALGDRVKLRMIVIPKAGRAGEARQIAEEIIRKLDEGVPFEELARVYSVGSAQNNGGDWGWAERTQLREELRGPAFTLKAGQHSGIIETPEQCFIMQVEETKTAGLRPLSEVRDDIEKDLLVEERRRLENQWIDRLKKKSFVRYF